MIITVICLIISIAACVFQYYDIKRLEETIECIQAARERLSEENRKLYLKSCEKYFSKFVFCIKDKKVVDGVFLSQTSEDFMHRNLWVKDNSVPFFEDEKAASDKLREQAMEERIANLEKAQAPTVTTGIAINGLAGALDAISTRQADMLSKANKKRSRKLCQQKTK